jgi:anaerobic magnesium-protoporphyrin IX monomethyl ester cyclase
MLEIVRAAEKGSHFSQISGIAIRESGKTVFTPHRDSIENLDSIPFPFREQFDNESYKKHYRRNFGYTTTSLLTSRGCPFECDFCSRPIFGNRFRTRTASNIADEVEEVCRLGYSRVWFADDCFTLNRPRLVDICDELARRRTGIAWECLSRVDTVDREAAEKMKQAGCVRVFFGIESGNDSVLAIMKKQVTTKQAEMAVHAFKDAGVQVGAFFILGYPGENKKTILDTVRFASSLPLDYLSFTLPYPIPGTPLFEKVKKDIISEDWEEPRNPLLTKHKLLFRSPFSETNLKLAILKGMSQFYLRKYLGDDGYRVVGAPFEHLTDILYEHVG